MNIPNLIEGLVKNLIESSEIKYKAGDYKGAILDRIKAKNFSESEEKYLSLIKRLKVGRSKYNLIDDYRYFLNKTKKIKIIEKLNKASN